ncbi:MAG: hypothetical protein WAV72_06045 [Bradyrhizobium sp.]
MDLFEWRLGKRKHRRIDRPHGAALEFSANIGQWPLRGIDLVKFNEAGEMVEFEVMVRPLRTLQALAEEIGNRIDPQLAQLKAAAGAPH